MEDSGINLKKTVKKYTKKTVFYVPEYLKFATAPFIQELRNLITIGKNNLNIINDRVIAYKKTSSGEFLYKNCLEATYLKSKMSDLTVDVFNSIVYILIEKSKTTKEIKKNQNDGILFCVDDLLFMRGKKAGRNKNGYRGGYTEKQRREIIEQLEILTNFEINVSKCPIPRINSYGKREYSVFSGESPLFYLKKHPWQECCYLIKPGMLLDITISGVGTKVGIVHKKILEYDYYRNFLEKRIGAYLSWLWRTRQSRAEFLSPVCVETLLIQTLQNLPLSRPQALRNRLENALERLENDGVIKNWQYQNIDESILHGKNWLPVWLGLMLVIEPPYEIMQQYSKIRTIKKRKPASSKYDYGSVLSFIKSENISQIALSEQTGINMLSLSGILSGKYPPSRSEKIKMEKWKEKWRKLNG